MNYKAVFFALAVTMSPCLAIKPLTSQDVVASFRKAGLSVGKSFPFGRRQLGMAPFVTNDMTRFLIPSLGGDKGGRVFVCESPSKAAKLKEYYTFLGESSAILYSHVFIKGRSVLQINGELPDNDAAKFNKVFQSLAF